DNYSITYADGALTVGAKALLITADNQSKTYGETKVLGTTAFTAPALESFDTITGVTLTSTGAVNTATVAGSTYPIVASAALGTGLDNYSITYADGALTVGARALVITADSQSKYCGQVDPALTYTITSGSLVFGHTFTGSLMRSEGESAGSSFAISMGSLVLSNNALSDNYSITFIGANLSIQSVDIDASTCNVTAALGTSATLKATVSSPVIPGVSLAGIQVFYKLDNGSGVITNYSGFTDSNGVVTVVVSGLAVEVYLVTVTAGADCASGTGYLAVYDPSGGFVTGGGWINSPAGSYTASPTLSGKANFGFVAKYKKGSTQVDGNTEFQFQTGNLNFSSSSHDAMSLVIAGAQAIYKGKGTINGLAGYSFMVSAIDGDKKATGVSDKFRIKIWNTVNGGVVYDNQIGQADNAEASTLLGGGSIVIHEAKKNISKSVEVAAKASVTTLEIPQFKVTAYPNPSKDYFSLDLIGGSVEKVEIDIFDMQGRKIKHIESASQLSIVFGEELPLGNYIVVVNQGANRKIIKLLKE
ncbi:MAG TPA: MBG domain-containing protein, partial [Flavobacterium sp.]|nr:MBG domain-containing protein [Flavobacterium sp.]